MVEHLSIIHSQDNSVVIIISSIKWIIFFNLHKNYVIYYGSDKVKILVKGYNQRCVLVKRYLERIFNFCYYWKLYTKKSTRQIRIPKKLVLRSPEVIRGEKKLEKISKRWNFDLFLVSLKNIWNAIFLFFENSQ